MCAAEKEIQGWPCFMFRKGREQRLKPLQIEAAFQAKSIILKMNARVANRGIKIHFKVDEVD